MTPRERNRAQMARIAVWHGMSVDDVLGRNRRPKEVAARRDCARYFRDKGKSFPEIGKIMGRDHTTVLNLVYGKGWKCLSRRDDSLPVRMVAK